MLVTKRSGQIQELDLNKIHAVLTWACEGKNDDALHPIKGVSVSQIEMMAQLHFYDKMPTGEIHEILIKAARDLISEDYPNYDQVAARLVWFAVRKEAFKNNLPPHLGKVIQDNVERGIYSKDILDLYSTQEINELNGFIDHTRDDLFKYAGAEQMRKKYLVQNRKTKKIFESFQFPYIMVAALLFGKYPKNVRMKYVKRYYDLISQHFISLPTPIMAGLRTKVKQFSSCVLVNSGDSLDSIIDTSGVIVKYASRKAGLGVNIGRIRAVDQAVRGGDAVTTGVIPFAKYLNAALKSCSQGAVRGASATFNYPIWHLEFERLIELKNNKGTDETRLRTVDYCIHINELFYKRLVKKGEITFFSPEEVPELYNAFYSSDPKKFEKLYKQYEKDPSLTKKTLPAMEVFSKIMQERFETGRIYILNADTVNVHGSFYESIEQTNLCLTGDTRIVTNQGMKTLEELYLSQSNFSVSSDIRAFEGKEIVYNQSRINVNQNSLGTKEYNSSKVFMTNPNADIYEVQLASGLTIKGTYNHKIMTSSGWVKLGDLTQNHKVYSQSGEGLWGEDAIQVAPFKYISSNNKWNNHYEKTPFNVPQYWTQGLGEVLGWLVGDGFISTTNNTITPTFVFGEDDKEAKPILEKTLREILPAVTLGEQEFKHGTETVSSSQIKVHDKRFGLWLTDYLGVSTKKSHEKTVPLALWSANRVAIKGFLRGLFGADGTVDVSKNCQAVTISLTSVSKLLLQEVQLLLSNFGIKSSIYNSSKKNNRLLPNSQRELQEYNTHAQFVLKIGKSNRQKFMTEIGFLVDRKNQVVEKTLSDIKLAFEERSTGRAHRNGTYQEKYQDKVVSINYLGKAPVYDITVDKSHSFIANGMAVHNCTEITLPTTPIQGEEGLVALCTLSAINWGKLGLIEDHNEDGRSNRTDNKLKDVCEMAVRALDALLDYQEYPVAQAARHTQLYRPLGIGIIGFAHWLAKHRLLWGAEDTLVETEKLMERMAYYLTDTSIELAKEFGSCEMRTKYHDGIFPIDTSKLACKTLLDWDYLKAKAREFGIRNATLMALMPSETSSQLANETNGIEPPRDIVTIKGSKEGVLPQLVPEYAKLNPYYQTLWEVDTRDYLKTLAVIQKYVDQAISVNTSYDPKRFPNGEVSMTRLLEDLLYAYRLGHKTLYYSNTRDGSGDGEEAVSLGEGFGQKAGEEDDCESGACKI